MHGNAHEVVVEVKIHGYFSDWLGTTHLEVTGVTVGAVLDELVERLPPAYQHHLRHPLTGQWGSFFLVLNEENLQLPHALERQLVSGDTLHVIAPVAGG